MSEAYLEILNRAAGGVSRETFSAILEFEDLFRRWNARINLAAPSTMAELRDRHIVDSAQLLSLKPASLNWLDLGSGGGFPGAVCAILLKDRPGAHVDLVESNSKKAAFLATTLGALGAPARVHRIRIEEFDLDATPLLVTARALAPLPKLLQLTEKWLSRPETVALFHKGRDYENELKESRDDWNLDLIEHPSRVDPASRVLEISNLRRRPTL
jgi:16S rRNA (guanine527-N7)-methyltransferase